MITREEAKEFLPIIQAFAEGKTIQVQENEGYWRDADILHFNYDTYRYRIKPEPKYRPFKDAEECWLEMQKHQPFGWVRYKMKPIVIRSIASLYDTEIEPYDACTSSYKAALEGFTFADGTPFGIMEESV